MVDHVSMCSVRAHLKQSVELGRCSSLLLMFTPPFETVIGGRSSIYVFSESPFKMVSRIRSLLKFTPQVTTVTCKFTARVTFKFSAHQVYYQCHLQVYCQSHLQVYFQNHLQVYPAIWNCHWWQIKYWQIYVFSEDPCKTAQVYSSHLLLNFTPQVHL